MTAPGRTQIGVQIDTADFEALKVIAEENDRTMAAEVRRAIRSYVQTMKNQEVQ